MGEKAVDLKFEMPETTAWVARQRAALGPAWVAACIRDGLRGVPGRFYAIERGHVVGTPFPADSAMVDWQAHAVATGCTFAGFMAQPGGAG